ncbi:MAG: hypothetical protein BWY68_00895 [bacterium ADurb.Bin400]|nr:MAG: hypothetical protein BWY68_00895 [bacterium ADurb.Bin400]
MYTGAVNNVSVGGLLRPPTDLATRLTTRFKKIINSKTMIHQGPAIINENIKRIYQHVPLKLAVLDAFEAMEGNGPINGDMVPAHFAIASSDPLAADWLACQLMGIDINDVGYLSLLNASNEDVFFVGNGWTGHTMNFKMHQNFESIRKWH